MVRRPDWARFAAAFRLEVRLIARHWSYWLLNLVFAAFMLTNFSSVSTTPQEMLLGGYARNAIGLMSLFALFLAAFSAGRLRRVRFDALESAMPTQSEVPLARWLAVSVVCLPLILVPLFYPLTRGSGESWLMGAPTFVFEAVLSIAFSTALAWLVEVTVGVRRWMFPLLAAIWMGATILPVVLNSNGLVVPGLTLLSFPRFGPSGYHELWGRFTLGDLPGLFNLFYAGLTALLAGIIALRISRQRTPGRRWPPVAMLVTLIGGVIAVGAGGVYTARVASANAQVMAHFEGYEITQSGHIFPFEPGFEAVADTITTPPAASHAVTAYDLTLDVGATSVAARMTVMHRGVDDQAEPLTALDFTLNPQFTVTAASTGDGAPLAFAREGRSLRLTLAEPLAAGESVDLQLTYGGALWYYNIMVGAPPEPRAFITPDRVYLPLESAWYPMPGSFPLALFTSNLLPDVPARFDLRIENADGLTFGSNLRQSEDDTLHFASTGARWAHLFAAPRLGRWQSDGLTLYAGADEIDRLRAAVEASYAPIFIAIREFMPEVESLVVFTGSRQNADIGLNYWGAAPAQAEGLNVVERTWMLQLLATNPLSRYQYTAYGLMASLFGAYEISTPPVGHIDDATSIQIDYGAPIIDNIAYFLWLATEAGGDADAMRAMLREGFNQTNTTINVYGFSLPGELSETALTEALIERYAEGGAAAVRPLIATLRAKFQTLRWQPLDATLAWLDVQ
jgi:hypothetical protein